MSAPQANIFPRSSYVRARGQDLMYQGRASADGMNSLDISGEEAGRFTKYYTFWCVIFTPLRVRRSSCCRCDTSELWRN